MNGRAPASCAVFIAILLSCAAGLRAQTVCDFGNQPLDSAQPSGVTPAQIIEKFAASETSFKAARDHYAFTESLSTETITLTGRPDGLWQQIWDITE